MEGETQDDLLPVMCAWCERGYHAGIMAKTQASDCAANVWQVAQRHLDAAIGWGRESLDGKLTIGAWVIQGHYGSDFDTMIYKIDPAFERMCKRADPVCDNCIREAQAAGALTEIPGHYP